MVLHVRGRAKRSVSSRLLSRSGGCSLGHRLGEIIVIRNDATRSKENVCACRFPFEPSQGVGPRVAVFDFRLAESSS